MTGRSLLSGLPNVSLPGTLFIGTEIFLRIYFYAYLHLCMYFMYVCILCMYVHKYVYVYNMS